MKTNEETAARVLEKSAAIIKRNNKIKLIIIILSVAVLTASLIVTAAITREPQRPAEIPSVSETTAETEAGPETVTTEAPDKPSFDDEDGIDWNGKSVSYGLYEALNGDEDVLKITVSSGWRGDFVYEGKTLDEYRDEADAEIRIEGRLLNFSKLAEDLKYGEDIYKTGNEKGEKWSKELYEKTAAHYSSEIEKYIENGEVLYDKLRYDIENPPETAQNKYKEAQRSFGESFVKEAKRRLAEQDVICEVKGNTVIISVTKEKFETIDLEGLDPVYGIAKPGVGGDKPEDPIPEDVAM